MIQIFKRFSIKSRQPQKIRPKRRHTSLADHPYFPVPNYLSFKVASSKLNKRFNCQTITIQNDLRMKINVSSPVSAYVDSVSHEKEKVNTKCLIYRW